MNRLSMPVRALAAGALCLAVLGGMTIAHAWPLWAGQDVLMAATIGGGRHRSASGEYLLISTKADVIRTGTAADMPKATLVRPVQPWVDPRSYSRELRGRVIYVQLEAAADGEYAPVSVSLKPVTGAVNLRGLCMHARDEGMRVQYGVDAFFLQQDRIAAARSGGTADRRVQIRVAIASSGRARIRELLINGTPVGR